MKNLTLATAFVVLATTFATPGFAADKKVGDNAQTVAEITFVSKAKKKRPPSISHAVYRADITAQKQRTKTLMIDISGKNFFGHDSLGTGPKPKKKSSFDI